MCDFALDTITNKVAFGTVLEGKELSTLVHGVPLPKGSVRVAIVGEHQGNAALPFPVSSADMLLVSDAIGSHVAWPEKWVIRKNPHKEKKKGKVKKHTPKVKAVVPGNLLKSYHLFYQYAKCSMTDSSTLTALIDDRVFGVSKELIIFRENVIELLEMKSIGCGAIQAYAM